jgi:TolB-like protein/cytochrome c-type biogenesis protein CcmH/NrfG
MADRRFFAYFGAGGPGSRSVDEAVHRILKFDRFELDLTRGCVRMDGCELDLRPMAFRVLCHLAGHAGRLVAKEELQRAVWNRVVVSDDSLVQCIRQLRQALGDDQHRLIKTVARRGYLLDVQVSEHGVSRSPPPLALPDKPSIAVLPFDNISGDPEEAYFADGIAEDLITALSRTASLFVIARNSSFAFRAMKHDVRTIGSSLGVRYVVEGAIRKSGPRLRLTVQLIEAASGDHLWAEKFDGALDQIFEFQDRIIATLIGAIAPKLRAVEIARAGRKRTDSLDAYDLVLRSLPLQAPMKKGSLGEAIGLLDRAIALSPAYSDALALGAWCRVLRPSNGDSSNAARDFREASDLARRALEADRSNPVALRSAGFVVLFTERDYQSAWDLIDRSLAIDPNSASSWAWRGWTSAFAGEAENATQELAKAIRLSPFDQWENTYSVGMTFAMLTSGRFEEGLRWARKSVLEGPHWGAAHRYLIGALLLTGQEGEARAAAQRYLALEPGFSLRRLVEIGPFRRTPDQERLFDAMRQAGLPP